MRLDSFVIGTKVYYPGGDPTANRSRYSILDYIGQQLAILRPEYGTEFSISRYTEGFQEFIPEPTREDLKRLGDDLVSAIENAAWKDHCGKTPNLTGPTHHMFQAVQNWQEVTR